MHFCTFAGRQNSYYCFSLMAKNCFIIDEERYRIGKSIACLHISLGIHCFNSLLQHSASAAEWNRAQCHLTSADIAQDSLTSTPMTLSYRPSPIVASSWPAMVTPPMLTPGPRMRATHFACSSNIRLCTQLRLHCNSTRLWHPYNSSHRSARAR